MLLSLADLLRLAHLPIAVGGGASIPAATSWTIADHERTLRLHEPRRTVTQPTSAVLLEGHRLNARPGIVLVAKLKATADADFVGSWPRASS